MSLQSNVDRCYDNSGASEDDDDTDSFHSADEHVTDTLTNSAPDAKVPKSSDGKFRFKLPAETPDSEEELFKELSEGNIKTANTEQAPAEVATEPEVEEVLSPELLESRKETLLQLKTDGNELYARRDYDDAVAKYSEALQLCPRQLEAERAVLFHNRAACYLRQDKNASAEADLNACLKLNPNYVKALLKRANLREADKDRLDDALKDYKQLLLLEPQNLVAREACFRLPQLIEQRNEQLKTEMLSKLKELGNMVLKPFGLSTDNFKMQQDPNTGSYSINFQQNQ